MNPKVSICIPAYKQTAFLKKCLDSILIQKFTDYEVIITDDSPDNSVKDLLQQYDFNNRLVYQKNTVALGSPKNWNEGLSLAKGQYIKILHHDDWFTSADSLGKYVRLLDENPDVDFGFSACYWVYAENGREKLMVPSGKQIDTLRKTPESIFPENFISTPSTTIFRNTEQKEFFDENIKWLVDTEYYYRYLAKGKQFAWSNEALVKVLIEAQHQVTSSTRGNTQIEIKEWIYYYNKIRQRSSFNKANFLHLRKVFRNFNIRTEDDIRKCGVDKISMEIRLLLFLMAGKENYTRIWKNKEFSHLFKQLFPPHSKRRRMAKYFFSPLLVAKRVLKSRYLKGTPILSGHFDPPQIVDTVHPVVKGFEIDHARYNYGYRIILNCEKENVDENTHGRFQINWLDSHNNFVFATYIPFALNNHRDEYQSPLINNIPYYTNRGILYLTGHDNNKVKIHSFSFVAYNIRNSILHKLLTPKNKNNNYKFKIIDKPRSRNVLFIIPWMSVGGGDMVNLVLAKNLSDKNFNIHFFTSEHSKNEWEHKFRKITKNIVVLPKAVKTVKTHLEYGELLLRYIKEARIDAVVVSNSEFGYRSLPLIKNEFPNVKTYDILHGQGGSQEGGGFPEYSKPYDMHLDRRVTINGYLKEYLISRYAINPAKIDVIHNGIDTDKYSKTETVKKNDFIITFIGRLSYEKHPEKIVDVAEKLSGIFPDTNISFQIIGDGPMFNELNEKITRKNLNKSVHLKGYKDNIREELEMTDILLLCSEMEGLPIVILEAMSMSVPCIASKVGGIPELIDDGLNGYLIDYNDDMIDNFAHRIKLLYQNATLRATLGKNARDKIMKDFSVTHMIDAYAKLLN